MKEEGEIVFKKASVNHMVSLWPLFSVLEYDPTLDALIHGYHGEILCDDLSNPSLAYGYVGWNYYVVGDASNASAKALIKTLPSNIEIHCNNAFKILIKKYHPSKVSEKTRYAMDHTNINRDDLIDIINQPRDFEILPIDGEFYDQLLANHWSEDFVINFKDKDDYLTHGKGFVAYKNGQIIGGVSSFSRFNEGYDIEIITHEKFRRQGVAKVLGAFFVEECLKENKVPYWDAAHIGSVKLAESLGYTLNKPYQVLKIDSK